MRRRWNWWVWAGFLVTVVATSSYSRFFYRFPITRDVPWANWLLFALGALLWGQGLRLAFRQPELYRGKVAGSILALASLGLFSLFMFVTTYISRQLPASPGAPKVGEKAPDFTLPDEQGHPVTLSQLLGSPGPGGGKTKAVLLIFYRGYW